MQTPPAGNLKERIAALQQRSVSAPQQPSPQSTPVSKPSSPANSPAGSLRSKIAKFESKGGVPIPRSSFGLGAPAEGGQSASREMYGNRIPGVNRPSGSVSRSGSPLPGANESPGAAEERKRRVSTGAFDGSLDLAGVAQKLTYQRTLDKLNGTTPPASPGTDRSNSSEVSGKDSLPASPRRKSMQVIGAGRRSVSSMDVFSKYGTQPEYIVRALSTSPLRKAHSITDEQDTKREAPSIVISPEPSSASPSIMEGSQFVDEPAELGSDNPVGSSRSKPAKASLPQVASPTAGNPTLDRVRNPTIEHSPVTAPVSPTPTNGAVQTTGRPGLEHPPDSPYLEFAKSSSPPTSPLKVQPVIRKVTSPASPSKSTDGTIVLRPTRSSSLAPATRTSRSPSPTPSMIHRPESAGAGDTRAVKTILKARTTSSDKLARRPIVALVANRPPAPENEADVSYGSVTLASRSETNLVNPVHKKIGFSAVVHRKVTENTQSLPLSDARSVRSVPNMTSHARGAVGPSPSMASTSPGYGDLAALLAEAALLEEKLKRGESVSDIAQEMDSVHSGASSQPAPSVERSSSPDTYNDEVKDQVPPPPPPKGFPRMLSNLKKLTSSGSFRSAHGSHSRVSTSGSEMSSEDSASVGTPSDNGIAFPGSQSNRSLDRPSSRGSSALGVGYPPKSPKKNSGSRASSFADKIWHRGRTKSNNSNTGTFLCRSWSGILLIAIPHRARRVIKSS
jgi:hypothetical protein